MKLRLGTRGSALALVQAGWVEARLKELHPGLEVERVVITTSGDRFAAANPAAPADASETSFDKGLFVKEIEEALLAGTIDIAVHSSKDLPALVPEGLTIAAYPERESPRDVLIARGGKTLKDLPPKAKVASASLRRILQLKILRPDLEFAPMRGNVDTRLKKLDAGQADALVLAAAGLKRLGRDVPHEELADMVPAPGQGALAIECREGDARARGILGPLDDPKTRAEVEAERLFMKVMEGGCRMPLGALAELEGTWLRLTVFWSDAEGKRPIKLSARTKADPAKVAQSVEELARRIKEASRG